MRVLKRLRKQAWLAAVAIALTTAPAWAQPATTPTPLSEISKLSEEALDSIDDALNAYGNLQDFGDRYGTATRGLLDELIAEWTIATEITEAISPETDDPRLQRIRSLLSASRSDSEDFVLTAKERSQGLVSSDNAVRFRQRQISLYNHLLGGLKRDRELLREVQKLSSNP
jgi:hypothetical protein